MTRLEKAIEEIKAIRKLPQNIRPWIYDDNGNIRENVICGDVIPFLEKLKPYEINVSDKWMDDFIENDKTKANNTYNWGAIINHDINFWWRNGNPIIVMMIHILGDVRGNYTEKFVIKGEGRGDIISNIFENEAVYQYKDINDRYSADINIFSDTYEVYDSEKNKTIGEYCEIEVKDLLKEIEK